MIIVVTYDQLLYDFSVIPVILFPISIKYRKIKKKTYAHAMHAHAVAASCTMISRSRKVQRKQYKRVNVTYAVFGKL